VRAPLAAHLPFAEAADHWLDSRTILDGKNRARYIANGTLRSYREYIRSLKRFFAEIPLSKIHIGHIREYQLRRASGELGPSAKTIIERCAKQRHCTVEELRAMTDAWQWAQARVAAARVAVSPNKINQELGTLICILRRANLWSPEFEEMYEGLQREEADLPRALSMQEQEMLLKVAGSRKEWRVAYWYAVLALRTTASNVELRNLRLGDLNLTSGVIQIRPATAKNRYRVRTIPLAPDALWAVEQLLARAKEMGATEPNHFLFPFGRRRNQYEPCQPMGNSGIKRAWEALRKAAGVPWLRVHDLRHTAITRLAEAGVPIPVIMSMAGHVSRRMMEHYTQISMQAQRMAVDAAYKGVVYQIGKQGTEAANQLHKKPVVSIRRFGS